MKNTILSFLGLDINSEDYLLVKRFADKQEVLSKYGGKTIITQDGGLKDVFQTVEGKNAYLKDHVLNKFSGLGEIDE